MNPVDYCLNKYTRQKDDTDAFNDDVAFAKKLNLK